MNCIRNGFVNSQLFHLLLRSFIAVPKCYCRRLSIAVGLTFTFFSFRFVFQSEIVLCTLSIFVCLHLQHRRTTSWLWHTQIHACYIYSQYSSMPTEYFSSSTAFSYFTDCFSLKLTFRTSSFKCDKCFFIHSNWIHPNNTIYSTFSLSLLPLLAWCLLNVLCY